MTYDKIVNFTLEAAIFFIALCLLFCLFRALIGPRIADRLLAVNMIGTQVIIVISFLCLYLHEDGLADIAFVFAMLSFLASVVFTKVYTSAFKEDATGIPDYEQEEEEV